MRRILPIVLLIAAWPVRAQEARPLDARMGVRADELVVTADLAAAFRGPVEKALTSGLTHRVRVELRLVEAGEETGEERSVVGRFVRDCAVAYDLWSQRFGVALADPVDRGRRSVADYGQVVEACGVLQTVPVADISEIDLRRRYRLQAEVVLDPAEADEPEDPARPADPVGPGGEEPGGRSLFGAVASVFDRGGDPDPGARTRFVSPPFGADLVRDLLEAAAPSEPPAAEREEE